MGAIFVVLVLVAYWSFYPYKPFTAQVQPFQIMDEDGILKAGDNIIYQSSTCRDYEGEVRVNRVLVNDILVEYTPYTYYENGIGCMDFDDHSVVIPTSVPNGKYHLEITLTVRVNPIRVISTTFMTEEFEVRNPVLEKVEELPLEI